jgi:hypothetical protein
MGMQTHGRTQKLPAPEKFHGALPEAVLRHQPTSASHLSRVLFSLARCPLLWPLAAGALDCVITAAIEGTADQMWF